MWDNTPGPRDCPAGFHGIFHHDPSNPGLAAAYNFALQIAMERGAQWLMLLDQDTDVTLDFLQEATAVAATSSAEVLVPRLTLQGRTLSPFQPVLQGPAHPLPDAVEGLQFQPLQAFNSGAVFAVDYLVRTGGFDAEFPLDYLDHASFARLHRYGGRMYLLQARLEHNLSSQAQGKLSDGALLREKCTLAAERRWMRTYGSTAERRAYPLRLMRRAASVLLHKRDLRTSALILRTLFGGNR